MTFLFNLVLFSGPVTSGLTIVIERQSNFEWDKQTVACSKVYWWGVGVGVGMRVVMVIKIRLMVTVQIVKTSTPSLIASR
jgi:hypothetical protein